MGNWGTRLQDNDRAMNIIDHFKDLEAPERPSVNDMVQTALSIDAEYEDSEFEGTLGLFEWLMQQDLDIKEYEYLVYLFLASELNEQKLGTWKEPSARRQALITFRKAFTKHIQ